MRRKGVEPVGGGRRCGGRGFGACAGRNPLRGGAVSCQSLPVCPPPGAGPAPSGWGRGAPVASPEGRTRRPPRGGVEAFTLLGEGLVFVSEVMAAGGGSVYAPPIHVGGR